MLQLLQLNVDLLKLQREEKVQSILALAQTALLLLKQLSQATTQVC
jgi:hypothetical protein